MSEEKWIKIGMDTSLLARDVEQANNIMRNVGKTVITESELIKNSFKAIPNALDVKSMMESLGVFMKQVVKVHSEISNIERAFETMLGSSEKAKKMLNDLKDSSLQNTFEFTGLARQAGQLLAYGTNAKDVTDILNRLSEAAMGTNIPLEKMVELYNKAKTQEGLMASDIELWQQAGIPVISELSRQMGLTETAVISMADSGKISFSDINTMLINLTSEGGQYFGAMEENMNKLEGSTAVLHNALTGMFSEIGESTGDFLTSGIRTAAKLVENYETMGRTLLGLIATYGTYRVAVALAVQIEKGWTIAQLANYNASLLVEKANKMVKASMLNNPYVLAATAVTALASSLYVLYKRTSDLTEADKAKNRIAEKVHEQLDTEKAKIDLLTASINNEKLSLEKRKEAIQELQKIVPEYTAEIDNEGKLINQNTEALNDYLKTIEKEIKLKAAKEELEELYRKKRIQQKDYNEKQAFAERAEANAQNMSGKVFVGEEAGAQISRERAVGTYKAQANNAKASLSRTENAIQAIVDEIQLIEEESSAVVTKVKKTKKTKVTTPVPVVADISGAESDDEPDNIGKDEENNLNKILAKYQTYLEKRKQLTTQFEKEEAEINKSTLADKETALKVLAQKKTDALKALDQEEAQNLMKSKDIFITAFGDMSEKSVKDLRRISTELQALYKYLSDVKPEDITEDKAKEFGMTVDELKAIKASREAMDKMKTTGKTLGTSADGMDKGFSKVVDSFKKIFSNFGKDGEEATGKVKSGVAGLQAEFGKLQGYTKQATGLLSAMSRKEGDGFDVAAKQIDAIMGIAGDTLNGFATGGIVGGAIALVSSTATRIFAADKEHKKALKEIEKSKEASKKAYEDADLAQNDNIDKSSGLFGKDAYREAKGNLEQYNKYQKRAQEEIDKLRSGSVVTGSEKKGLFGWGGTKDVYSGLLDTYSDLIDGEGKLNKARAEAILNNEKLDESTKAALQSALQYTNEYEKAMEGVNQYVSSIFGELGNALLNAITSNLDSMENALIAFKGNVESVIEKMIEDMIKSSIIMARLKKYEDEIIHIQGSSEKTDEEKAILTMQELDKLMNEVPSIIDAATNSFLYMQQEGGKRDLNLWKVDGETTRQAATKGGISSMTQESADELNGRFTAIQSHTYSINENVAILTQNSSNTLLHLSNISNNTARLKQIENTMHSVKAGIDDINTKGIFIKQ